MEATIKYTPQQQALVDHAANGTGNEITISVAGSGKTSSAFGIIKVAPVNKSIAYCAFAKKIATEFEEKLDAIKGDIKARVFVGTIHKFAFASWRRLHPQVKLDSGKDAPAWLQGKSKLDYMLDENNTPVELRPFIKKAYGLARQWGAGVLPEFPFKRSEKWYELIEHFDLRDEFEDADGNLPDNIEELLKEAVNWTVIIIKAGIGIAPKVIDFEDMLYMPLRYNIAVWTYDWVIVDECQDLNTTKRAYIKKMLKVGGRAFFVGDPRQAIFGFTGADAKSFENIKHEFACKEFPLTYSFRCPKTVVDFAKQYVSHIESTPNAPDGEVRTIDASDLFAENLTATDAIVCRNNAPLVDLFFACIKKHIGAHIEGRDIGAGLARMIDRYPKIKTLIALETKLENYAAKVTLKAQQNGKEEKAAQVNDQVECILAVLHNLPPNAVVSDLKSKIMSMFQDAEGNKIPTLTLTSSHKSKGREWNRVFWYGRNRYNPSPYARQAWQLEQEDNLCYVSATRAKQSLILVNVAKAS